MKISFELITSLIISVITIFLSGFVSYFVAGKKIKSDFTKDLYQNRIKSYTEVFGITEKIVRNKTGMERNNEVRRELREWKRKGGLLLLSEKSWKAFYELESILNNSMRNYGDGDHYAQVQIDKLWEAKRDFRKAIKMIDLKGYYNSELDF